MSLILWSFQIHDSKELIYFPCQDVYISDPGQLPPAFCITKIFKQDKTILLGPATIKNFPGPEDKIFCK